MLNYCANGPSGYNLTNSLRFRASASANLSRTPSSSTNRNTWTVSLWAKRSNIGGWGVLLNSGTTTNFEYFTFRSDDTLQWVTYSGAILGNLITTQVFRDPSAWYHIVFAFDSTQATSSNRLKLYINGSQVTAFGTATYPSLNYNSYINLNQIHNIGRDGFGDYFDGYMAEYNFIDGQALTPSSFGSTNATTGVWQPAKYTGTYGTNGFYLNFSNIALTSGSNTGLGKDYSGNGNYWNTNNISVTSGTTYDAMTDVPTLTSATVANYATLNPVVSPRKNALTYSNANLTANCGAAWSGGISTILLPLNGTDKWYAELGTSTGITDNECTLGITSLISNAVGGVTFHSSSNSGIWYNSNGKKFIDGTETAYGATWTNTDIIGIAVDSSANTVTFYKNNTSQGSISFSSTSITAGQTAIAIDIYNITTNINFGQRPFSYTPPTGYVALNTYNLPTSTIVQGNKYMDATAYTGTNGSPTTQVISSNFQPDFLWFKKRSAAYDHALIDTNRGITKQLYSNLSNAEGTDSDVLTAIGASSFTVGNSNYSNYGTLVAWTWKANGGTTSSNTQGSITSTVQANTTAGFSVVTYTGNGTNGATVGHGLGVTPAMIIIKNRTSGNTNSWRVWQKYLGTSSVTQTYLLDGTNAAFTDSNIVTAVSANTFTLGIAAGNTSVNGNSNTYVAYCWAEIAGFSKFGSYVGNGSTDGPFIYLGFRPKYIMRKATSAIGDWIIFDTSIDPYNLSQTRLLANTSNGEQVNGNNIDILSNGWKERNNDGYSNNNGTTYIYFAFAENPFKNALAR